MEFNKTFPTVSILFFFPDSEHNLKSITSYITTTTINTYPSYSVPTSTGKTLSLLHQYSFSTIMIFFMLYHSLTLYEIYMPCYAKEKLPGNSITYECSGLFQPHRLILTRTVKHFETCKYTNCTYPFLYLRIIIIYFIYFLAFLATSAQSQDN